MTELMALLADLAPLSAEASGLLIFTSFFTSLISAAIGLGGGVMLLAIMASVMPPLALIPVHGVAQLGSNAGRAWTYRQNIQRKTLIYFAVGSVVGAALGAVTLVALPPALLTTAVGLFVLYSIWLSPPAIQNAGPWTDRLGGGISTFLTMFFGATGPFVSALLKPRPWTKAMYLGTFSGCMCVQHGLKTVAFLASGFDFLPWAILLAAMITTGYAGTRAGAALVNKLSEDMFSRLFKYGVTLIAARLIILGVIDLFNL